MQNSMLSPIQLNTQLYEVNASQQPFQIFVGFPDNPMLDQYSPHIAVAAAREIQNHCMQQANGQMPNPIRINMFNVMSDNAFMNETFAHFARSIMVRMYMGFKNGEFNDVTSGGNVTVPNMVRYFAAWLALKNPMVLQGQDAAVLQSVNRDAQLWERQMHMLEGRLAFEPFSAQMLNETLGQFSVASTYAAGGGIDMCNSGAFVPGAHAAQQHHNQYRQNGNNASPGGNRFTRQLEERKNMLQGSMQTAMAAAGMAGDSFDNARWDQALAAQRERHQRVNLHAVHQQMHQQPGVVPSAVGIPTAAQVPAAPIPGMPTQAAQSSGEAYSEVAKAALAGLRDAAPQPQSFIFNQRMDDGKEYGVVRMVRYKDREANGVVWKSTPVQRVHPAWDPSCQDAIYFELENGQWVAVIEEGKDMSEKLFNYEAHAVNPTKGFALPEEPKEAAAPEAPVTFASEDKNKPRQINVAVPGRITQELDEESVIASSAKKVRGLEGTPDAYLNQGNTMELVTFENDAKMLADLEAANGLVIANSFQAAIGMLAGIENEKLRELIDSKLTKAVNDWLANQAGLPQLDIDKFSADSPDLEEYLRVNMQNALLADKLKSSINGIIAGAYKTASASPFKDVLESMYSVEYSDERLERSLVVMTNCAALWLNRTEETLNVMAPEGQPCVINKKHLPFLHAVASCAFTETAKSSNSRVSYLTLVLSDGKRLILSESALSSPDNRVFFITRKSS